MEIVIKISPAEDDEGNEMVELDISKEKNEGDHMAVLRAAARMMRAIAAEHLAIHRESKFIKDELGKG